MPSTPMSENMPRDSPRVGMSRPTSIHEEISPGSGATTPTAQIITGKKPRVVLSKVMKYDVDHRKRSYRPERINLHYDRLHNPDNCYHIRIDWMNVTAKLIEDAIEGWAREALTYGLRLVEVPIAEACAISEVNPFRRPYLIRLALPPPNQQPVTYYEPNSFTLQVQPGRHFYQKAILRRFDSCSMSKLHTISRATWMSATRGGSRTTSTRSTSTDPGCSWPRLRTKGTFCCLPTDSIVTAFWPPERRIIAATNRVVWTGPDLDLGLDEQGGWAFMRRTAAL